MKIKVIYALIAVIGQSTVATAGSCVSEYHQYSLYPDFHSIWPGGAMQFDFENQRIYMNDVGDKVSLNFIDGWHIARIHSHKLIFAAPTERGSSQVFDIDGYQFTFDKEIKEMKMFGTIFRLQEVKARSDGEVVLRLLVELDGGVRAILVPSENEFGLTNWAFHSSGVPLFDLASSCYSD